MFSRFHEKVKDREEGFTLIELLVVILIIAILAAIAIPVFLNQRKKGWISQTESTLKNMATAEESFLTGSSSGVYTDSLTLLAAEGFKYSTTDVSPAVKSFSLGTAYCLVVTSVHDTSIVRYYDSDDGRPLAAVCT